jgi:hypothetical protein
MLSDRTTPLTLLGGLMAIAAYAAIDLVAERTAADAIPSLPLAAAPQSRPEIAVVIPAPVPLPASRPVPKFVIDLK